MTDIQDLLQENFELKLSALTKEVNNALGTVNQRLEKLSSDIAVLNEDLNSRKSEEIKVNKEMLKEKDAQISSLQSMLEALKGNNEGKR